MQSNKKKKRAKAETTRWHTPGTPCSSVSPKKLPPAGNRPRVSTRRLLSSLIVPFEGSSLFVALPSRDPRPTEETATPSLCFRFVLLEVAKRNGEARERDEEREPAREREERERVGRMVVEGRREKEMEVSRACRAEGARI